MLSYTDKMLLEVNGLRGERKTTPFDETASTDGGGQPRGKTDQLLAGISSFLLVFVPVGSNDGEQEQETQATGYNDI
jgi:hypothetical protein